MTQTKPQSMHLEALPAWLMPALARALPDFRGAKSRSQGGSFLLLLAPHITEETGGAPALVTLSQAASPQTPNSEVADGLSLNSTLGQHQRDRKAPLPPQTGAAGRKVSRGRGAGGGGETRTDQAQTPKLGGGSQQQKCPCLFCNGTRPGTTVTPFSPSLTSPPPPPFSPPLHAYLPGASPPSNIFLFLLRILQKSFT